MSHDPRDVLKANGLWSKKHFGQNFLVDPQVPGRIASVGGVTQRDTAFEIGAGVGTLTRALSPLAARVVALEHDRDLVPLARRETSALGNVEVREGNVLDLDWLALAEELGPLVVYGNIPYNLSTSIVVSLLEARTAWTRVCLMVQREFAIRLAAPPGTRKCGSLSAQIALWTWPTLAFEVPSTAFHPKPKVDSAVLVLERRNEPAVQVGDPAVFRQVVRALFGQRRKMARKALRPLHDGSEALLVAAGVDPTERGEALDLAQLAAISRALVEARASV